MAKHDAKKMVFDGQEVSPKLYTALMASGFTTLQEIAEQTVNPLVCDQATEDEIVRLFIKLYLLPTEH